MTQKSEAKVAVAHRSVHQRHRRTQSVPNKNTPTSQRSLCYIKFVKCLVRKNRALSMSKNDDKLNEFIDEVTDGTYNLSCVEVIFKLVKKIQTLGDERFKKIVSALVVEGIKICITDDIWYSYSYVCAYFLQCTF
jgi:hypothetical protein